MELQYFWEISDRGVLYSVIPIFPECEELKAMNASVHLFLTLKVDVIIGPACSIGKCPRGKFEE